MLFATAPTVNADGTPRPTYINLPHDNEQENENDKYNIEKLRANRLKSHAYDEIDGKYLTDDQRSDNPNNEGPWTLLVNIIIIVIVS